MAKTQFNSLLNVSLEACLTMVMGPTITTTVINSAARKRLHGDDGVRAALQNTRVASLLPPVGTEVFRCLTAASLQELQQQEAARTMRGKREKNKEVHNMTTTCQQTVTTITRDTASEITFEINVEKKFQQPATSIRRKKQHLLFLLCGWQK